CQVASPKQSDSAQSIRLSQSSSKPFVRLPASLFEQPHAGVPAQLESKQSTIVSQAASLPLFQFSPPGGGAQPHLGAFTHAGSRQSATPLQLLSAPSV